MLTAPEGVSERAVAAGVAPAAAATVLSKKSRYFCMGKALHDMHCSCKNGSCQLKVEHRGVLESMSTEEFDEWRARFPSCGRTCMHRGKFRAYKEAFNKVGSLIWRRKKDEEDEEG